MLIREHKIAAQKQIAAHGEFSHDKLARQDELRRIQSRARERQERGKKSRKQKKNRRKRGKFF